MDYRFLALASDTTLLVQGAQQVLGKFRGVSAGIPGTSEGAALKEVVLEPATWGSPVPCRIL